MKKVAFALLFIMLGLVIAGTITITTSTGGTPHAATVDEDDCGENPYDICLSLCGSGARDFDISTDPACFNPDSEYFVGTSVPTNPGGLEYVHYPGDPIALAGPFHTDDDGNASLGTVDEITSGGFEGTVFNDVIGTVSMDKVKLQIEHHYLGMDLATMDLIDYFGALEVLSPSYTDNGDDTYSYAITGYPSGAKRVTFFIDENSNNTLDGGELFYIVIGDDSEQRDIGIVGEQYDDSVDCSIPAMLDIEEKLVVKPEAPMIRVSPNPFNSALNISLSNFKHNDRIVIRDFSGKTVQRIDPATIVTWDGKDVSGMDVPSGIYFVGFENKPQIQVKAWLIR